MVESLILKIKNIVVNSYPYSGDVNEISLVNLVQETESWQQLIKQVLTKW